MSRQKQALAEELLQARREVERQNQNYVKVAKEKEILTQDKGELIVQVTATGNQGEVIIQHDEKLGVELIE